MVSFTQTSPASSLEPIGNEMPNKFRPPFIDEYAKKAEFIKEVMRPVTPNIKIPANPQVELTREQVKLTKELVDNSKHSDKRSKRAELISWIALFVGIAGMAISAIQLFTG